MNDTYRELEGLFGKFSGHGSAVARDSARKFLDIEAECPERLIYGFRDARVLAVGILANSDDVSDVGILVRTFEVAEEEATGQIPPANVDAAYLRAAFVREYGKDVKKAVVSALSAIRQNCERNGQVEEFDAMMELALEDKPVRTVLSEAMEERRMQRGTGYASKYDSMGDGVDFMDPVMREAMLLERAGLYLNPFIFNWGSEEGRERRIARLKEFGGTLGKDELADDGFLRGLSAHGMAESEPFYGFGAADKMLRGDAVMAEYLYRVNEAVPLYEALRDADTEKLVEIGLPAVASLTIVLGRIQPMEGAMEALGRILDGCEDQDKVAAFEAEVDRALSLMQPKDADRASEPVSRLREMVKEKREALMGGTLSEGTVKPPAKKEAPKKPGPLKRKR